LAPGTPLRVPHEMGKVMEQLLPIRCLDRFQRQLAAMGWFSSSKPDPSSTSATADPLRNLDPELRAFLEQESPVKYKPTTAGPRPPPPPPRRDIRSPWIPLIRHDGRFWAVAA